MISRGEFRAIVLSFCFVLCIHIWRFHGVDQDINQLETKVERIEEVMREYGVLDD